MNVKQITRFLEAIGRQSTERNGDWIHASCPFASIRHENGTDSKPSFGILVGPGDSRVYCLSCFYAGTCGDVVVALQREGLQCNTGDALDAIIEATDGAELGFEGDDEYEKDAFAEPEPDHVYPAELLDSFEPAYAEWYDDQHAHCWTVHPYLDEREVSYEVAKHLDLRWDVWRRRIIFPVRDFEGQLRGLHGRHVPGEQFAPDDPHVTYKMYPSGGKTNPEVWLGEHWLDPDRPVLIAESVFDLARVLELYDNCLSPLTAGLKAEKVARLQGAVEIVTIFDSDKAGERARKRLHKEMGCPIRDVILPPGKDAGETPLGQLHDLLEPHLELKGDWL